jgi:nitroimidazol reductase NimA-like FMN-containing flavoprotein (pyridoxamine 5'-phosphate oxidase superfamily)
MKTHEISHSLGRAGTYEASTGIVPMDEPDAWAHLHVARLGRVCIVADGRPHVFPVNYAVADRTIVFRTAPGAKLEHGPGSLSCFEADGYDERSLEGWSVMAFGRLEEITYARDEQNRSLRELPLHSVAPGHRRHWIAMDVDEITGRHFHGGWVVPGGFFG